MKPLLRGEPQHGPCQRFWLARNVQRRGGNHPAPAFPWGKRERGIKFLAAAGHSVSPVTSHLSNVALYFPEGLVTA